MKYAVEIADTKSISKAAENLYMGQPNLSRAIKELEENLGITIFKRTTKGITVTPEGEEFLQYAKRIISQVEEVEEIYKNGKKRKQRFSACVSRASYISEAFAQFAKNLSPDEPAEIFYKETNSMRTIKNVVNEDCNIGIIRYQSGFDKYFSSMFSEKKLNHETITEFSYRLLMSKEHPLAEKENIEIKDLSDFIEISHADPYVPSLPLMDVRKAELSDNADKHIYIFERGSQFDLLTENPETFMWVSPLPKKLLQRYDLCLKHCIDNTKIYKDVLIYRKDYSLSELDNMFITELIESKRKCF